MRAKGNRGETIRDETTRYRLFVHYVYMSGFYLYRPGISFGAADMYFH